MWGSLPGLRASMRLDRADVLRSRWLLLCAGVYGVLAVLFVWVGLRESSVLGFTGLGRVYFSLCHALLLVLPLLALTGTGPTLARAREDGALELWLSQPIGRLPYLWGVTLSRFAALALPLAATLAAVGAVGVLAFGQAVPWPLLARVVAVSAAVMWAFVALGIAISVSARSVARATTWVLLAWALSVALLDAALIGVLLQWRLPARGVFLLAVANPVQSGRLALLSGADPELAVLGPVGFYVSTQWGAGALFGLGIVWPVAFGAACMAWASRRFRNGDAV